MSAGPWSAALDAPVFATLRPWLAQLRDWPTHDDLNALAGPAVASGGGAPIRFVAPAAVKLPASQYESRIYDAGEVQTRHGNWHDLFNALVWIAFPKTKAILNRHHRNEIVARRGDSQRGTARDVVTLFDEGGVLVGSADAELSSLLRESRWKELFWSRRADVQRRMRFHVFGHAIYEKALAPYKGVTAKALILEVDEALLGGPTERALAELDTRAAAYFSRPQALASTRTLPPLPILGVPGWESSNEREDYYEDAGQFRPGRASA